MSGRSRERDTSAEKIKRGGEMDKDNTQISEIKISFPQWSLLDHDKINILLNQPVDQFQLHFEALLNFKKHQTCLKEAAQLEYFVNGFWWTKEMNFTSQQVSFIMALLQQLLDNINNKHASFADNFKAFTQTLLATKQSSSTEAKAVFLFSKDEIKAITDYFKTSLFQHYRLYELLFSHRREEKLMKIERCVELVDPSDFAVPLEEGMSADLYLHHVAPRVQMPQQEVQESHEEQNLEDPEEAVLEESPGNDEEFNVEDVREVLEETTREMLDKLQAEFTEELRLHEETLTARIQRLQTVLIPSQEDSHRHSQPLRK